MKLKKVDNFGVPSKKRPETRNKSDPTWRLCQQPMPELYEEWLQLIICEITNEQSMHMCFIFVRKLPKLLLIKYQITVVTTQVYRRVAKIWFHISCITRYMCGPARILGSGSQQLSVGFQLIKLQGNCFLSNKINEITVCTLPDSCIVWQKTEIYTYRLVLNLSPAAHLLPKCRHAMRV